MDLFDMSVIDNCTGELDLEQGMARIKCPTLVIGVKSDILFPSWQQREIAQLLRETGNTDVTHLELDAMYGHDTFLIDLENVGGALQKFLNRTT
jgi:homoserine O-acetyltransferase